MSTCIQRSVVADDISVMGLVKAPAFCINLVWNSLHECLICHNRRPCLFQKYLIHWAKTEKNIFWQRARRASSPLHSFWSFSLPSAGGHYVPYISLQRWKARMHVSNARPCFSCKLSTARQLMLLSPSSHSHGAMPPIRNKIFIVM